MADTRDNINVGDSSAAAWSIAVVVILAVIVGAVLLYRNSAPTIPNTGNDNDINVTVPTETDTGGMLPGAEATGTTY